MSSLPSSQLARKCLWVQTANLGRGTWNCPKMCPKWLVDWENHHFQSSYSHCNMNVQFLCPVSTSWSPRLSHWSRDFPNLSTSGCGSPRADATLALHPSKSSPESPTSGIQEGFTRSSMKAIGRDFIPVFQRSIRCILISPGQIPNFQV